MLAERFRETLQRLEGVEAERRATRAARDQFIAAHFPTLDAAFVGMVRSVTGIHPRLAVVTTPVTDIFTGRGFATLDRTVVEVRSTLYGSVQSARFTPGLEAVAPDQFGAIRVTLADATAAFPANGQGALLRSILDRGVLMRGAEDASLVVATPTGFEPLAPELLEAFLTGVFVRT